MELTKPVLYVPEPQFEHMEPPVSELYVPMAQFEQEEAMTPKPVLNVPTGQIEHVVADADNR